MSAQICDEVLSEPTAVQFGNYISLYVTGPNKVNTFCTIWVIQFSNQNENMMLTVSPLVFFLTDARFAYLFKTKMTKVGPRFTKSHSMIQDYPGVTTTAHARSAIECSLLCEAYASFCNHFHFAGHNTSDNCNLLMWNGVFFNDWT